MNRLTFALVVLVVLVGATGAVTAHQGTPAQGEGPPDELPDPVPEFVTDLLDAVSDFVDGAISALGDVVSGITPGDSDTSVTDS